MIFEFFGLPGVGKTFYANKITEDVLLLDKVVYKSRIRLILFIMRNFVTVAIFFWIAFISNKNKFSYSIKRTKVFISILYEYSRANNTQVLVRDQGLLQNFFSIHAHVRTRTISKWIKLLVKICKKYKIKIIYIYDDYIEISKRFLKRNKEGTSFDELSNDEVKKHFSNLVKFNEVIYDALVDYSLIKKVYFNDNNIIKEIKKFIDKLQ